MWRTSKMGGIWYAFEMSDQLSAMEIDDIFSLVEGDSPTLLTVDLESAQDALPDEIIQVVEPD